MSPQFELHPLNQGFSWRPHEGPFRLFNEAEMARFDADGFLLLENAVDGETLSALRAEIDPLEQAEEKALKESEEGRTFIALPDAITFTVHLVKQLPAVRAFSKSKIFQDITHDLIGPNVRLYWDQAVYKKPENPKEFPFHQDNGYTFIEPQAYLTCWVPLVDATVENGCPWVVPGLHKLGTLEHKLMDLGLQCMEDHPEAVPVPAKAGSIVIFSSLTPHRTGPNLTRGIRKALILQYAPDGARMLGDESQMNLMEDDGTKGIPQDDPTRQFLILKDGQPAP
ncbi:MAG: phytanoyl-CoA dioxygenase family protein [Alphaproteobacteria bacterium]|nr:MAG: phytanoyl-CoA dioxygenase family protein [Alphaproteobacteria bacterium]